MGSNQIELFKKKWWYGTFTEAYAGTGHWGSYVELLQGWRGEGLTWKLTGYVYRNRYLFEVKRGR